MTVHCLDFEMSQLQIFSEGYNRHIFLLCLKIKVNVVKDHKANGEDRFLLVPSMYSKNTDTHQSLSPKSKSCHPKYIAKNIPVMVANRCSDSVKYDQLFKDALIDTRPSC